FFHPSGRTIVAQTTVFDADTGKVLNNLKPPDDAAALVGFTPDGKALAYETYHEGLTLWEPGAARTGLQLPSPLRRQGTGKVMPSRMPTNFAFTLDGKGLVRRSGALQRWDLATGKPLYPDTEGWGHTEEITRLVFAPDGKLLASG